MNLAALKQPNPRLLIIKIKPNTKHARCDCGSSAHVDIPAPTN
jgi:hypothetical protein